MGTAAPGLMAGINYCHAPTLFNRIHGGAFTRRAAANDH
jgi:hypothetical protein